MQRWRRRASQRCCWLRRQRLQRRRLLGLGLGLTLRGGPLGPEARQDGVQLVGGRGGGGRRRGRRGGRGGGPGRLVRPGAVGQLLGVWDGGVVSVERRKGGKGTGGMDAAGKVWAFARQRGVGIGHTKAAAMLALEWHL
jgi:hypothetical protein